MGMIFKALLHSAWWSWAPVRSTGDHEPIIGTGWKYDYFQPGMAQKPWFRLESVNHHPNHRAMG